MIDRQLSDTEALREVNPSDFRHVTSHLPPDLANDVARLQSLSVTRTILDACCRITGMGFAAVARVTPGRWIACGVRDDIGFGLAPGGELPIETTLCRDVIGANAEIVIENAADHPVYSGHPSPTRYGFRSYISVPIRMPDGRLFGTLCAIDPSPRTFERTGMLDPIRLFADLIAMHLDAEERLERSERALSDERGMGRLREEFIAVLGHDLRNPLASIDANAELIEAITDDPNVRRATTPILKSVRRMVEMVSNLLDLTRGRLGGGIELDVRSVDRLGVTLAAVIQELAVAHPDRRIEIRLAIDRPIECDPDRISQLLSNLVGNAVVHGSAECPVEVEALVEGKELRLSVANGGEPIPDEIRDHLFQPFRRAGSHGREQGGLGLGLHIAHQIALAHKAELSVESDRRQTVFTLRMPINN